MLEGLEGLGGFGGGFRLWRPSGSLGPTLRRCSTLFSAWRAGIAGYCREFVTAFPKFVTVILKFVTVYLKFVTVISRFATVILKFVTAYFS